MKIVTNDYGCGTSSSILDYGIDDVIVVSENNWKHIFEANDDLLFIGHDFLMYMWDTDEKVQNLKNYPHAKMVWCFERIDAIIPAWRQKSFFSLSMIQLFADEILACDEDDCDKMGFKWLPQWASNQFFELRSQEPNNHSDILFSGQAGKPEYQARNNLLAACQSSSFLKDRLKITNIDRSLTWSQYIQNLLNYNVIINPVGVLKALNTRAYEGLYSGRWVLQHQIGKYERHLDLLKNDANIVFFQDYNDLLKKIEMIDTLNPVTEEEIRKSYEKHNLHARMKSLGIELK